jgi:hypothetical protein
VFGSTSKRLFDKKKLSSLIIIEEESKSKIIYVDEAPSNRRTGEKIHHEEKFCSFLTFPRISLYSKKTLKVFQTCSHIHGKLHSDDFSCGCYFHKISQFYNFAPEGFTRWIELLWPYVNRSRPK